MNLQHMIDGFIAAKQRERAASEQMTLGELITALEAMPADLVIAGLHGPHSYRGYYCDLAFEPREKTTAGKLLELCRGAMGRGFTGYKGGDYTMGENTPVWVANYGDCGLRLMILGSDGTITVEEEEEDS
jgi:hypothetical protein